MTTSSYTLHTTTTIPRSLRFMLGDDRVANMAQDMLLIGDALKNSRGGGMVVRKRIRSNKILDDQTALAMARSKAEAVGGDWNLWNFKGQPQGDIQAIWIAYNGPRPLLVDEEYDNDAIHITRVVPASNLRWDCQGDGDIILWRSVQKGSQ